MNLIVFKIYLGDICRRGKGSESDYVCKTESECELSIKSIKSQDFLSNLEICTYYENQQPIICCPSIVDETVNNSFTADESVCMRIGLIIIILLIGPDLGLGYI